MEVIDIDVLDQRDDRVFDALVAGVRHYNAAQLGSAESVPLAAIARDGGGRLVGGVAGRTIYGHLLIEVVWVDESRRGQGLGRQLMERAEQVARERGCVAAQVDTLSFQGPAFYGRLGYAVIGTVPDFPPGHQRFFLLKSLGGGQSERTDGS